jgi:hypothetical protein
MSTLAFDEIDALALAGGRFGKIDLVCPLCAPWCKRPTNRKRRTLRVWRDDVDFARFNCARCGAHGHTRADKATSADPQEYLRRRAEAERQDADDERKRTWRALEVWNQAVPIAGTLAERYLSSRRIDLDALPEDMSQVLRWHPRCPWERGYAPCLVALWTDVITGEPKGIHRTALTATAEKIDRMSLGPIAGAVIRLWPDDAIAQGLVVGEGVETTLAAATRIEHRGTLLQPAWACGDAGHVRDFPVLAGIEALTVLVDNDVSGQGQAAAEACARRWRDAGREVTRLVPRIPGDFNDIVKRSRHDAAA